MIEGVKLKWDSIWDRNVIPPLKTNPKISFLKLLAVNTTDPNFMTDQQFLDSGQRGLNQLYETGIKSNEHSNAKVKK
ncbi:MAG: hypothetical protein ACJAV5_001907 [Vicingaceae bacterium]